MNRLQKKCAIVTAGVHLLLVVILLVGPAFLASREKADNLPVLDVIPANLIDAAFNSGVANAQPPLPAVQPAPPPPAPVPAPEPIREVVKTPALEPKPVEKKTPNQPHKIDINTQPTTRTAPKASPTDAARALAIKNAIRNLKKGFAPGTTIEMPGNSSVAYANYAQAVKSVYDQAWTLPAEIANSDETTKVSVSIASDGTVISAHIVTPSGDAKVDASVQRTLERVTFIAPFPEGAVEKERTYIIYFNPRIKQSLE